MCAFLLNGSFFIAQYKTYVLKIIHSDIPNQLGNKANGAINKLKIGPYRL
jgi:hypothetical protein